MTMTMRMMTRLGLLVALFLQLLWLAAPVHSFVIGGGAQQRPHTNGSPLSAQQRETNYLMDEFRTYKGELLDPYKILKVDRMAERSEVRKAYLNLSKRYHPDVVMHKDILPGSCNDLDDVRDQWERIKMSYEILSDKRTRKRYDRHEFLADPGNAVQRAAWNAMGNGVKGVGKGVFSLGKGLFDLGAKAVANKPNNNINGEDQKP